MYDSLSSMPGVIDRGDVDVDWDLVSKVDDTER